MKVLQSLFLILGLVVLVNAQKAILSGTLYDATGAVIPKEKVIAINSKGEKFEALTDNDGVYSLSLPFNSYDAKTSSADFRIAKFEIVVDLEHRGFEKFSVKAFKFVPAYSGKLLFDIALDADNSNCGAGGCIENERQPIELSNQKVSNKILQRPSEKLPKEQNKTKKISGKVLEPDEAAGVPRAKIIVFTKHIKFIETFTDLNGNYELFLPFGQYRLEVNADGFVKSVIENFSVSDNKNFNLDLKLEIGVVTKHSPITENKK